MTMDLRDFDPSEYLDDDEIIAEFLTAALEDPSAEIFLSAIGDVAKARGMTIIPGIDHLDPTTIKVFHIAGCDRGGPVR
jgi:DNA-binding phage protein